MKRLEKKHVVKTALWENDEVAFWKKKSTIERLKAVELNRKIIYRVNYEFF